METEHLGCVDTNSLLTASATLVSGPLAGINVDRAVVAMPPSEEVGGHLRPLNNHDRSTDGHALVQLDDMVIDHADAAI